MKYRTHFYKFYHYFSDLFQTKIRRIILPPNVIMFNLIFFAALFTFFSVVCKTTASQNSVFNSDKKTYTINANNNKLTQSFKLKKGIIYNDTLSKSTINFYYIDNPVSDSMLYLKYNNTAPSSKYIQFFDNTYKELNFNSNKKSSYLCIDINTILSETSDKKRIYISLSSASSSDDTPVCILYEKKKTSSKSKNTEKNNKDKADNKIKATATPHKNKHNTTKALANKKAKSTSKKSKIKNKIKKIPKINHLSKKHTTKTKKVKPSRRPKVLLKKQKQTIKKSIKTLRYVSLSNHYVSLKKGKVFQLKFATYPTSLKKCKYIWSTSNKKVAIVSNGKITGKSQGIAIIRLKITHKNITKTSTCTIRVTN